MTTVDTELLDRLGLTRNREPEEKAGNELGQEAFLRLMITQLNNQDPLQPMENGEFYTQIAQFSTVAGIQDLQESFREVASALSSGQAMQASSMIGRGVLVAADEAALEPGEPLVGVLDLPRTASSVDVDVIDSAGQVVRQLRLGEQDAGRLGFSWDGLTGAGEVAPPGVYRLEATMRLGGETRGLETMLSRRVDSVTVDPGGKGVLLNLSGGGQTSLGNVREIL